MPNNISSEIRHSYLKKTNKKTNTDNNSDDGETEQLHSGLQMAYSLDEVVISDSPFGIEDENWCRYVLVRGALRITGYHRGTIKEVTKYANEYLIKINERNRYLRSPFKLTTKK